MMAIELIEEVNRIIRNVGDVEVVVAGRGVRDLKCDGFSFPPDRPINYRKGERVTLVSGKI